MLGTIAGDLIGSHYEFNKVKTKDFDIFKNNHFTDDTLLTVAVAKALVDGTSYKENIIDFGQRYNEVGFGASFREWLTGSSDYEPYKSWGNGSAMRVSPIAYAFNDLSQVLEEAKRTAEVTHNHEEGIKGAQAVAAAIFLALKNKDKPFIKQYIESEFNYDLDRTVSEIRPDYKFDVSCQGSVPESIICFLESTSYEDCVRNAVSLGGDADTMAAMAGGIAEAYYKEIPQVITDKVDYILPKEFKDILKAFSTKYPTVLNEIPSK